MTMKKTIKVRFILVLCNLGKIVASARLELEARGEVWPSVGGCWVGGQGRSA